MKIALNSIVFILLNLFNTSYSQETLEPSQEFTQEDVIKPHSDMSGQRALCVNYYLTPGWKAKDGAALCFKNKHASNGIMEITPKYNRMVAFIPSSETVHWVSPMLLEKDRFSIVSWHCSK